MNLTSELKVKIDEAMCVYSTDNIKEELLARDYIENIVAAKLAPYREFTQELIVQVVPDAGKDKFNKLERKYYNLGTDEIVSLFNLLLAY